MPVLLQLEAVLLLFGHGYGGDVGVVGVVGVAACVAVAAHAAITLSYCAPKHLSVEQVVASKLLVSSLTC